MFVNKWLKFLVLVSCVPRIVRTNSEQEVSSYPNLKQVDLELILSAQSTLRKHLINVLSSIRGKIIYFNEFHSAVDEIVKGLQTRTLDPLQSLDNEANVQNPVFQISKVIFKLQGCTTQDRTFENWNSFLMSIPGIHETIKSIPNLDITANQLPTFDRPLTSVVLLGFRNDLRPSTRLLKDILYNYNFNNYSPDLEMLVTNTNQLLDYYQVDFGYFQMNSNGYEGPDKILSEVLKYVLRQKPEPDLMYQIAQILSALSTFSTVNELPGGLWVGDWFASMRDDDYPPDVTIAKNELLEGLKQNQTGIDLSKTYEDLKSYSPTERLLGLIAKLTLIPSENPLAGKVHAIYPHVKLRYLNNNERFFVPRSSSDFAFLLNSFLTVNSQINPLLIREIHRIFLSPEFQWEKALERFDYSRYSKPRSLIMDILQEILNNQEKLPACDLVLFTYFLKNNSIVPECKEPNSENYLNPKLTSPTTPISVLPDIQETYYPKVTTEGYQNEQPIFSSTPPNAPIYNQETYYPTTTVNTPLVKQCPDGMPQKLVDPESIVEIIDSNYHTNYIADLIRYNAIPAEQYINDTRVVVFKKILSMLRDTKYNDGVTEFVIDQALQRIPLNHKGNLMPRYMYLCPHEIAKLESNAPTRKPFDVVPPAEMTTPLPIINSVPMTAPMPIHNPMPMTTSMPVNNLVSMTTSMPVDNPMSMTTSMPVNNPMTTSELVTNPAPMATPSCENPAVLIDQNSLIEIANRDVNYNKIRYLVSSGPIFWHDYKDLATREQVLRAVLETKKQQTNDPVEQYDITQTILKLVVTADGQMEPITVQECLNGIAAEAQILDCPKTNAINPYEVIDIMLPVEGYQIIKDLILSKPILVDQYGRYSTRGDVYRAVLADRSHETHQNVNELIQRIPLNSNADLAPSVIEICQPPVSTEVLPLQCKENEELKRVIDPNSLLEIIDDTNIEEIEELLLKVPLLADKYSILGNRVNILLQFLRQHYIGCKGNVINPELLGVSSGLHINSKGNLLPVLRDECVMLVELPTDTTQNMQPNSTLAAENKPITTPATVSPETPKPMNLVLPSQPESCHSNEVFTTVYSIESVFEALSPSAPNVPFVQQEAPTYLIPYEEQNNHTKAEVLTTVLNALAAAAPDEIKSDVDNLKTHIQFDGPGSEVPLVMGVCLSKNALEEETLTDEECLSNETLVPVVNTDSLLQALGPNAPNAPYITARIKAFIIPISVPRKYNKADILRDILNHLEADVIDLKIKEIISLLRGSILATGPGAQEPDVVQVCLPSNVMEEVISTTPAESVSSSTAAFLDNSEAVTEQPTTLQPLPPSLAGIVVQPQPVPIMTTIRPLEISSTVQSFISAPVVQTVNVENPVTISSPAEYSTPFVLTPSTPPQLSPSTTEAAHSVTIIPIQPETISSVVNASSTSDLPPMVSTTTMNAFTTPTTSTTTIVTTTDTASSLFPLTTNTAVPETATPFIFTPSAVAQPEQPQSVNIIQPVSDTNIPQFVNSPLPTTLSPIAPAVITTQQPDASTTPPQTQPETTYTITTLQTSTLPPPSVLPIQPETVKPVTLVETSPTVPEVSTTAELPREAAVTEATAGSHTPQTPDTSQQNTSPEMETQSTVIAGTQESLLPTDLRENNYTGTQEIGNSLSSGNVPAVNPVTETTQIYDTTTGHTTQASITLTGMTTASPMAYITEPVDLEQQNAEEFFKWPIILKPKLNETCYDKKNKNHTIPIQIVNVTSLFDVLVGGTTKLDQYLTTTYLTSLDSYYKLYDFAIDSYRYKNTFLHDVLNYLLSFDKNLETDNHVRKVLSRISFMNNAPLRPETICNKRIFEELPKPISKAARPVSEIFFGYETLTPCYGKGFVSYNIGTSLKDDMMKEVLDTLTDYFTYANKQKLFEGVKWEEFETQRDLVNFLLTSLEKQKILNENQRQVVDYLYQHLKCDVLRFVRPTVFKECLIPDTHSKHFMKFKSTDVCGAEPPFTSTNITYYLDVFSLLKTLNSVQTRWTEELVFVLSNPKTLQNIGINYPLAYITKGELFLDILKRLAQSQDKTLPISTIRDISREIGMFGYGSTPVEVDNDCPNMQTPQKVMKFLDKITFAECNITHIDFSKMGQFIRIQTLLDSFVPGTSRKHLILLRGILKQPNIYTILPGVENVRYTNVQFLQGVLESLIAHSSSLMGQFLVQLKQQLDWNRQQELIVEKMCESPFNTNGEYLIYPTTQTCSLRNFDLDITKVLEAFHPNISENQISTLGALILTKDKTFYDLLMQLNVNSFETYGDLFQALLATSQSTHGTPVEGFLSTLKNYIKTLTPPLTVLTTCDLGPINLGSVISDETLQRILQRQEDDELSFRLFDDPGITDDRLKELENSVIGQLKLKENLYSLLGGQGNYSKHLELLLISDLYIEGMYSGFDVIKELPDHMETEILLKRYLNGSKDEDVVDAVEDIVTALEGGVSERSRRQVDSGINLLEMIKNSHVPENLLSKAENLALNLSQVYVDEEFRNILPAVRSLQNEDQIPVLLRMMHKKAEKTDLDVLRELHNFFVNEEENIPDIAEHFQTMIQLLTGYINSTEDEDVKTAAKILIEKLQTETYEDWKIQQLVQFRDNPKKFLTASLKRFRDIVNKKQKPDATSIWLSTNRVLSYLGAPEHYSERDANVIEVFSSIYGSESILKSKGIIIKYLIDNKNDTEDVFEGIDFLENFADEEMALIVLKRLMRKNDTSITEDLETLSQHIHTLGYDIEERLKKDISLKDLIHKIISPVSESQTVESFLTKAMNDRPEVFEDVLRSLVIAEHQTPQQQLSEILRQFYRMYAPKLGEDLLWAINSTFQAMNTYLDDSSEDSFSGDFTPQLSTIIRKSLPLVMSKDVEDAYLNTVTAIESHKQELKKKMKGIRLFVHPIDLRSRILILQLRECPDLTETETRSLDLIWNYLDISKDEVLEETINESRKASEIFTQLLGNPSEEIMKEKEVILDYISSRKHRKFAYKGVKNDMQDIDVLVKILDNVSNKLTRSEHDVVVASNAVLKFLEVPLTVSLPKEHNNHLRFIDDLETTFEGSEGEVQQSLTNFTRYLRTYPATFNKMTATVSEGSLLDVLKVVQSYEAPISNGARTSALVLQEFLVKDETLLAKKSKRSESGEFSGSGLDESEVNKFEALKEASVRFLFLNND